MIFTINKDTFISIPSSEYNSMNQNPSPYLIPPPSPPLKTKGRSEHQLNYYISDSYAPSLSLKGRGWGMGYITEGREGIRDDPNNVIEKYIG
jgi:hypothetical protein